MFLRIPLSLSVLSLFNLIKRSVANFDFFAIADNYPFDWQHIYISFTISCSAFNYIKSII